MKMAKAMLCLVVLCAAAATIVGLWLGLMADTKWTNAERIISNIEKYRQREGRLPDPANHSLMQELGFELGVGWLPDYEPLDAANYRITILVGFDGPYWFYESTSKRWVHGYPSILH